MSENKEKIDKLSAQVTSSEGYVVAIDAFQFTRGASFAKLIGVLWSGRWWLIAIGFAGAVVGTAISFVLEPEYRATVTTVWKGDDSGSQGLGALGGQLGSLASAAGLLQTAESTQSEAMAVIHSRHFSKSFIESFELMPVLFSEDWDDAKGTWGASTADDPPSVWDAVDHFETKVRHIDNDIREGTISISMRARDPQRAADWANEFVRMANVLLQRQRIAEAEASLDYLQQQLETQDNLEIQASIYRMMESQLSSIVFARVRPEFAFRVVDPAVAPEPDREIWPNKPMFLVTGGLLGGMLGIGFLLVRQWQTTGSLGDD